ncbi:hypothetical protein SBRY_40752 [Actinacidiphila bryophytorum]|uniref:Uncharacterized protein n=1 Tax=Actinacidiphila bryophytorum TaxID=1436133 RepID=A0A9W4H3P1_9ACTN|nr:hypothetical protein SBRY_40752 [Actinacidiphila bryophytorum]
MVRLKAEDGPAGVGTESDATQQLATSQPQRAHLSRDLARTKVDADDLRPHYCALVRTLLLCDFD